jgi:polyhydroxyalkanoate synthase
MTAQRKTPAKIAQKTNSTENAQLPDPIKMARAMAQAYEDSQPVFQKYWAERGSDFGDTTLDPLNVRKAWMSYAETVRENPQGFMDQQFEFWNAWSELCTESTKKFLGESDAKTLVSPAAGDRRFKAAEWSENPMFDFIKQSYLMTSDWMENTVRSAQGIDDQTREKLSFSARLLANAISPSNFPMTNPEVLKETLETGGENLIKGMSNFVRDMKRGDGSLKISTTDYDAFNLGDNIASTPGAVVFENDLIQLIQYTPTTETVSKRPLLVIPPWINKYYILDLRAENSYIKWAVDQGHTVFIISWINPDKALAKKRFEDYMNEGILAALDSIQDITEEPDCNVVGYCLGGTLLATTLAYLSAHKQEKRVANATFLTTLLNFEQAGEMKLFMDDTQLELMDRGMAESGVLQAKQLQQTFSLLRSNDLIWSFVVNNYLMGREPFPFDLLYWNDDSTNMPAAMHSFYLRKMYRDNVLIKAGGVSMNGTPIDLSKIKTPCYFLSTREDHIAPWRATYAGTGVLNSKDMTFTLAASGHIAGVVNPPVKNKYCYWTSNKLPTAPDEWMEDTTEHAGSWWPHWDEWLKERSGETVKARKIRKADQIEPAPGRYVKASAS